MKPLGLAIIGASVRSQLPFRHFEAFPDEGFITGLYDLVPGRCQCFIDHFKPDGAVVYGSLAEATADERVDAVFVATSDDAHVEAAVAALQAGKNVFCEKPMAITLEGCDAIIDAARAASGIFYLGMNLRHSPMHETMHEILQSGRLGKLLTIETNEYYYGGRSYFRRWNCLRARCGGLWITKACHDFDLLNWFAGGRAKRIFATSSLSYYKPKDEAGTRCRDCPIKDKCPDYYNVENPAESLKIRLKRMHEDATGWQADLCLYNSEKDTFDNAMAIVDYDNDVRASFTVNVVSARDTRQMRLMGTEGAAEGEMSEGIVTVWKRHERGTEVYDLKDRMDSSHGGADVSILRDFFRCCRTGEKPRSSWMDGRASVELGLAARDSCDTGKAVELPIS